MTKPTTKKKIKSAAVNSPIFRLPSRAISDKTRLLLYVRAGGRCEFDGCNRYLMEHPITRTVANLGQMAHIVAFKGEGPRGGKGRPANIHDIANLMLVCPDCHKEIDTNWRKYTRRTLEEYKQRHEQRIRQVTQLGPDRSTFVILAKMPIRGDTVQIPDSQIWEATAPRYPTNSTPFLIDLTRIHDGSPTFINTARDTIRHEVARLFSVHESDIQRVGRLALFALGPMPLLVYLGNQFSNKIAMDVFQRHRDTEDWTWKTDGEPIQYQLRQIQRKDGGRVALLLCLSGTIPLDKLPDDIQKESTIYELTLRNATPQTTFLRLQRDLEGFRIAYQEVLGEILRKHGLLPSIDLIPAVPAPIAVLCGRELLPQVHPGVRVYDGNRTDGYKFILEVNQHE